MPKERDGGPLSNDGIMSGGKVSYVLGGSHPGKQNANVKSARYAPENSCKRRIDAGIGIATDLSREGSGIIDLHRNSFALRLFAAGP